MATETKIIITAATAQAEAAIKSLGNTVGGATRQMFDLSGVAATLTGALSITAFAGIIKGGIDAADELNNLSIKTGTSVEQLAGLKYAAEQSDTSLQAVAGAAKKLSSSIVDQPEVFAKLGITATDSTGALIQMADIFANMPDGIEKNALAIKLMGKSGEEMIPFLNQGGEAIRALVEQGKEYNPVTAESARMAAEFNDNLDKLKASAGQAGMALTNDFLPGLSDISIAMAEAARQGGLLKAAWVGLGGLGTALFTDDMLPRMQQINNELEKLRRWEKELDGSAISRMFHPGDLRDTRAKIILLEDELRSLQKAAEAPVKKTEEKPQENTKAAQMACELSGGKWVNGKCIKSSSGNTGKSEADRIREQERAVLDSLQRQADGYAQLSQVEQLRYDIAAGKYKGFEQEKLREMELLAQQIDLNKSDEELKKYTDKLAERAAARATQRAEEASKAITDAQEKESKRAQQVWENFTVNVQRNLGDVLYNGLNGNFQSIGDGFAQMLKRMAADAAAAKLTEALLGGGIKDGKVGGVVGDLLGAIGWGGGGGGAPSGGGAGGGTDILGSLANILSFEGGGYTGNAPRTGGLDGKGGFFAIMHPQENVYDLMLGQNGIGSNGGGVFLSSLPVMDPMRPQYGAASGGPAMQITYSPVINIDSRTDRADVQRLVSSAVAQGNAQLVDHLQRNGMIG